MEPENIYSISIVPWLVIIYVITYFAIRHLYVNWEVFGYSYKMTLCLSILVLLPLLLASIWSDDAFVGYLLSSFVLAGVKIHKSRVERSSIEKRIDDSFFLFKYPAYDASFRRLRAYFWHLSHDMLALLIVWTIGEIFSDFVTMLTLFKIFS